MGPVLRVLAWTAIVALPGGMLLLPVMLADHVAKKRRREASQDVGGSVSQNESGDASDLAEDALAAR